MTFFHAQIRTLIAVLVEFGPITAFFTSLYLQGEAEGGFIASIEGFVWFTAASLGTAFVLDRRVALFPLLAAVAVIGFGTAAVYVDNPTLFIIKDTVYNGLFALVLGIGALQGQGPLKYLFSSLFDLTERGWYLLSRRWAVFFLLLAVSNELVWRIFSEATWVSYKLGATIATLVFGLYQFTLARRERSAAATPWGLKNRALEEVPESLPKLWERALAILVIGGCLLAGTMSFRSVEKPPTVSAEVAGVSLTLFLADTEELRSLGLGGRESLEQDEGMLFIFPKADRYGIWMKDMRFPIDIFWIGDDGRVASFEKNVGPETYPHVFYPDAPVRYVLETNAGFADRHGIDFLTPIRLQKWPVVSE